MAKPPLLKLPPRREPYYTQVGDGLALGYVRREHGPGSWVRRELISGTYRNKTLGLADDLTRADGRDALTFLEESRH